MLLDMPQEAQHAPDTSEHRERAFRSYEESVLAAFTKVNGMPPFEFGKKADMTG